MFPVGLRRVLPNSGSAYSLQRGLFQRRMELTLIEKDQLGCHTLGRSCCSLRASPNVRSASTVRGRRVSLWVHGRRPMGRGPGAANGGGIGAAGGSRPNRLSFSDMAKYMSDLVKSPDGKNLDGDERNMFSVAFKNVAGGLRASFRIIAALIEDPAHEDDMKQGVLHSYRREIEAKIVAICTEVVQLLETYLVPAAEHDETKVFYLKMHVVSCPPPRTAAPLCLFGLTAPLCCRHRVGDYFRYVAEIGEKYAEYPGKAKKAYEEAAEIAESSLPASNPVRLGLALNFSVFLFEIVGDTKAAVEMAQTAFDRALEDMEGIGSGAAALQDADMVLRLLKDNLTLWTTKDDQVEQ